jgi:hypothetical protein
MEGTLISKIDRALGSYSRAKTAYLEDSHGAIGDRLYTWPVLLYRQVERDAAFADAGTPPG